MYFALMIVIGAAVLLVYWSVKLIRRYRTFALFNLAHFTVKSFACFKENVIFERLSEIAKLLRFQEHFVAENMYAKFRKHYLHVNLVYKHKTNKPVLIFSINNIEKLGKGLSFGINLQSEFKSNGNITTSIYELEEFHAARGIEMCDISEKMIKQLISIHERKIDSLVVQTEG
ncbi:MAG: hypothetical protein ACFCUX_07665, partial [Candidatus Methylacidiphilales bacterium]